MREFVLSEAPLDRVAAIARATVEDLGGVVAHHTQRTTEFDNLLEEEGDWARSGYIGTYSRYRQEPVRLRIRVWAEWPRKLSLWSVWLGLVEALIFFSMSFVGVPPPPNVWILTAIATFALMAIALLMYATSWADSADLEDEIARKLKSRVLEDDAIVGDVYTIGEWEEYRADVIDRAVQEAERQAPERASRAKRVVQAVASGGEGPGRAAELVQRFRPGQAPDEDDARARAEEDEDRDQAREDEALDAETQPSPEDDGDPRGVLSKLAFWRRGGDEDDAADDELAAKRQRLEELKRRREQAGTETAAGTDAGEGGESSPKVESETDEARETAEEDDQDATGLASKLAFWRRGGDEDDDAAEDAGPEDHAADTEDPGTDAGSSPPPEADASGEEDDRTGLVDKVAFWRRGADTDDADDGNDSDDGDADTREQSFAEADTDTVDPNAADDADASDEATPTDETASGDATDQPPDEDEPSTR